MSSIFYYLEWGEGNQQTQASRFFPKLFVLSQQLGYKYLTMVRHSTTAAWVLGAFSTHHCQTTNAWKEHIIWENTGFERGTRGCPKSLLWKQEKLGTGSEYIRAEATAKQHSLGLSPGPNLKWEETLAQTLKKTWVVQVRSTPGYQQD